MSSRRWATALPGSPLSLLACPASSACLAPLNGVLSAHINFTGITGIEILALFAKIDILIQSQPPSQLSPEIPPLVRSLGCHKMGQP